MKVNPLLQPTVGAFLYGTERYPFSAHVLSQLPGPTHDLTPFIYMVESTLMRASGGHKLHITTFQLSDDTIYMAGDGFDLRYELPRT